MTKISNQQKSLQNPLLILLFIPCGKLISSVDLGQIHSPLTDGPSVKCVTHKTFLIFKGLY